MSQPPNYAAILLAAGRSRRMGGPNKLLLPVGGAPMVRLVARTILAAVPTAIVVLGHEAARVAACLEGLKLATVVNPDRAGSQMSSVRTGLAAAPVAAGYLICLADQPSLTAADYAFVLKAADRAPDKIIVPIHQGQRGNPIVLPAAVVADLAHEGINIGCRQLIAGRPDRVSALEVASPAFVQDIDTPEAYRDQVADPAKGTS